MAGGELPVDIDSPEFRAEAYNYFISLKENADNAMFLAEKVEGLTFKDLTPETWAMVVGYMQFVKANADYIIASVANAGMFMDNANAIQAVKEVVMEVRKEES